MVVFASKMGIRKFGSVAPPFSEVACAVLMSFIYAKDRVAKYPTIYSKTSLYRSAQ